MSYRDTVDAVNLNAFYARYAGGGSRNQPFRPAMMVKVPVYGYATGVFNSRRVERRLHEDLAFRMLGAGNFPRHRTIRDFRAMHLLDLSDLFVQVVKRAQEMGLVKLASRHKAMSYDRMQQAEGELKAQIDALLERAKSTDAAEADEPELDIPAEIERRADRLKAIRPLEPGPLAAAFNQQHWVGKLLPPTLLEQLRLPCCAGGLGAVHHGQRLEDARDVRLDGLVRKTEFARYLFIRQPRAQLQQHLDLALGQEVGTGALLAYPWTLRGANCIEHERRYIDVAGQDQLQRRQQRFWRGRFRHVPEGSQGECAPHVLRVFR